VKILFASALPYLPQLWGGLNTNTHELAIELVNRGHEVTVLCRLSYGNWFGLRRLALMLARGRRVTLSRSFGYSIVRVRRPWEVASELAGHDVMVIQDGSMLEIAAAFAALGTPAVAYLHGLEFENWQWKGRPCQAEDLPMLGYFANSQFTANRFRARYGLAPRVIPPVFRSERYRTEPAGEFVTFINPVSVKGLDLALAIAACCPHIPFSFVKAWPLPAREWLRLRKGLWAAPNITLHARTSDMREVYRRTRILLAPSQWEAETWGRVVSEAQFSGIPAVVSNRGGLPEAVGPGGIVLGFDAPAAEWATAIERLWTDDAFYAPLSAAARAHAGRAEFDIDVQVVAFVEGLVDYIGRRSSGGRRSGTAVSRLPHDSFSEVSPITESI
jgi:glycosyltransferase involved in cell wall biosynthesis